MKTILEQTLVLIPARAGSKGVADKNVRPFAGGLSLVERACAVALEVFSPGQIVVSSDGPEILDQAEKQGVIAHQRPGHMASDTSGMTEVMLDAVANMNDDYRYLLLLQPTSPFRRVSHLRAALEAFREGDNGVVGMHETKSHPQFTLFRVEGEYASAYTDNTVTRRQDAEKLLQVNGLIYLLVIDSLKQQWNRLDKIRPLVVPALDALDIDTPEDWWLAELIERAGTQRPSLY